MSIKHSSMMVPTRSSLQLGFVARTTACTEGAWGVCVAQPAEHKGGSPIRVVCYCGCVTTVPGAVRQTPGDVPPIPCMYG